MSNMESIDLAQVNREAFQDCLNSEFKIQTEEGAEDINISLIEVEALPDHRSSEEQDKRAPFSLVFQCDTHLLEQGVYQLTHPTLSLSDLFLSPFSGGESGCKMEAIFN